MSRRFAERFGRAVALERVMDDLPEVYDPLAADFAAFFPELRRFVDAGLPERADPAPDRGR